MQPYKIPTTINTKSWTRGLSPFSSRKTESAFPASSKVLPVLSLDHTQPEWSILCTPHLHSLMDCSWMCFPSYLVWTPRAVISTLPCPCLSGTTTPAMSTPDLMKSPASSHRTMKGSHGVATASVTTVWFLKSNQRPFTLFLVSSLSQALL